MQKRSKYLIKNTSIFAIGQIGSKLINFFLVPFYTYVLSNDQYGTADLLFTIAGVIAPIIMLSIGEAVMRFAMDRDAEHNKLFSTSCVFIICGSVIALLIFPVCSKISLISPYCVYLYLYVVFLATKEIVFDFLKGQEKLKIYVLATLIQTTMIAVLNIIFLVQFHMGVKGYLLAYIISEFIAILFAFFKGRMYIFFRELYWDKNLTKQMVLFSIAVIPNSLLWWVVNSSDRIMITAMRGTAENGILAVGSKIPSILTMLGGILMQAWKFSAIKESDSKDKDEYTNKMLEGYIRSLALISAFVLLLIKPITSILFEKSYYSSWEPSIFLVLGFSIQCIGTFIGTVYYVKKDMIGNLLSALSGAVVNIVLNFALIPIMGAAGATLAACISYFMILVYRSFDTRKYQKINLVNQNNIIIVVLLTMMTVGNYMDSWFGNMIYVGCFIILVLMNLKFVEEMIKSIFRFIFKKN